MVIQANAEVTCKSTEHKQNMESKKYIVVMNHVREILNKNNESSNEERNIKKVENLVKPIKKRDHKVQPLSSSDENNEILTEISKSDLKELKTVYKKCKAVLINIETKYGHLLNLGSENEITNKGKRKHEINEDEECNCTLNKKIVFDEQGREVYNEGHLLKNHICSKKLKTPIRHFPQTYPNVEIEFENSDNLPESIQELTELLKNPSIKSNIRRSIIGKIKNIREEYLNTIRFERHTLIEKLKTNSEEIIDFKGTNLSSLAGYPDKLNNEKKL